MQHFAIVRNYIVTANANGSVPLSAKCGAAVDTACVEQANLAPELLEALQMVCDSGVSLADEIEEKMLAALRKATSAQQNGAKS